MEKVSAPSRRVACSPVEHTSRVMCARRKWSPWSMGTTGTGWRCINTHRSGNARIGKRAADRVRRRHGWPPVASLCRFSPLLFSFSRTSSLAITTFPFSDSTVNVHHRAATLRTCDTTTEVVVSFSLQVRVYGVSLKRAAGKSGEKWNVKKIVVCRG